jgi:hypothetical protein
MEASCKTNQPEKSVLALVVLTPADGASGGPDDRQPEAAEDSNNNPSLRRGYRSLAKPNRQPNQTPNRRTSNRSLGRAGTAVIGRCGLPEVKISARPCVTAGGRVDWLVDYSRKPTYRFISFARETRN